MTSDLDVRVSGWCVCGAKIAIGYVRTDPGTVLVKICKTGEHVTVGRSDPRVYIYVENPGDVIDIKARCWLCGGVDPNDTVTVARKYPDGPQCPAYKTMVHTGCWQDMEP